MVPVVTPVRYVKGLRASVLNGISRNVLVLRTLSAMQKGTTGGYLRRHGATLPLFRQIQIETVSRCNNDCAFCAVNIHHDRREFGVMGDDLYLRILTELKDLSYSGLLSLFNNDEPLIDRKIVDRVGLARKLLPDVPSQIWSNGKLLDYDKLMELNEAGLSELLVNNYNDGLVLNQNICDLVERLNRENPQLRMKFTVVLRKKNEVMHTRGGNAPNKQVPEGAYRKLFCIYPFTQMNVNYKGDVTLCCNDAYWDCVLGNVAAVSLEQVWHSPEYGRIRDTLRYRGRAAIPLCSKCDNFPIDSGAVRRMFRVRSGSGRTA